jgi:hypothetical protein
MLKNLDQFLVALTLGSEVGHFVNVFKRLVSEVRISMEKKQTSVQGKCPT